MSKLLLEDVSDGEDKVIRARSVCSCNPAQGCHGHDPNIGEGHEHDDDNHGKGEDHLGVR